VVGREGGGEGGKEKIKNTQRRRLQNDDTRKRKEGVGDENDEVGYEVVVI
jgi:hypothetical protein